MRHLIIVLLSFISFSVFSQEEQTIYFKDKYRTKETKNIKKAKSKCVITTFDNIATHKTFLIKRGKESLLSVEHYKGYEPVGVWKYYESGSVSYESDYSSEIIYVENKFESEYYFKLDKEITTDVVGMTAPKLIGKETIFHAIYGYLKYPAYARENGVQGQVLLNIKITKEGKAEPIGILKGTHPSVDKEAWMVIYKCDKWEPATFNGEPIDSYALFPIKFKLEG